MSVFVILATVGVRCQYLLKEYAPHHDNYESYSFAYGVSDPISGDHKHQWERMEHGHVRGEYGLMEPDGLMRLVQYTAGPHEGFKATVKKLSVHLAQPEFTQGRKLYQEEGEYDGSRYAAEDNSGLLRTNQNKENVQPEYVQLDYGQKINKIDTDYVNQESQHHIITRSLAANKTITQNRRQKEQSSSNRRKQIVKKNIETQLHLLEPGFTAGGTEYISNFNMNPLNIDQLNIPYGEKKILHGLSIQENQQHRIIPPPLHPPRQFNNIHIQNTAANPFIHPSLIKFQQELGHTQFHGYQIIPNHHALPLIQNNPHIQTIPQSLPTSIEDNDQQKINSFNDKRLQNALASIHNHPEVKTRLEHLHNLHNIPQEQTLQQEYYPRNHIQQIPVQGSSEYEPTLEGKRYNNENQTADEKEEERQYLLGLRPLNTNQQYIQNPESHRNIPQQNYQTNNNQNYGEYQQRHPEISYENTKLESHQNIPQQNYQTNNNQNYGQYQQRHPETSYENTKLQSHQNIPQQNYQTNNNQNYGQYQQRHPEISYENTKLSSQNHYPVVLVDPKAKLGLPFYPSSKEIHQVPFQEYNYEGIPLYGPNLEGKRYNTENQTEEQKEQERQYLLGINTGPLFPPPPGYTRETIWQAGDRDADPEPEILVRQLNETCAYIQINETTPGTEDGRLNIWQAGDYSAQRQEEELIRSVNITCENYTADAMSNFSSGYTVVDYCWQCVSHDGSDISEENAQNQGAYEANNEQQQQAPYDQNHDNTGQQQTAYVQNVENNGEHQQQVVYVQNDGNNEQYKQQTTYVQSDGQNIEQNQESYETNVEKYHPQDVNNQNSQTGTNEYQQGQGPMKMVIYPNFGYRNDPESRQYGLYRRRSTNKQKEGQVSDNSNLKI